MQGMVSDQTSFFTLSAESYWISRLFFFVNLLFALASKFQCRNDANDNCIRYYNLSLCDLGSIRSIRNLFHCVCVRIHSSVYTSIHECVFFTVSNLVLLWKWVKRLHFLGIYTNHRISITVLYFVFNFFLFLPFQI